MKISSSALMEAKKKVHKKIRHSQSMNFRIILLVFFLMIPVSAAMAYNISFISISPGERVPAGAPVAANFTITFPSENPVTFPGDDDLFLSTDLVDPQWNYHLILDGVDNPRNPVRGKRLDLSGFELSYPAGVREAVTITLTGTAPPVNTTTPVILFHMNETNTQGQYIGSYRPAHKYVPPVTAKVNGSDFEKQIIVTVPAPSTATVKAIPELNQHWPENFFDLLRNFLGPVKQFPLTDR